MDKGLNAILEIKSESGQNRKISEIKSRHEKSDVTGVPPSH
jgi:hypothetical protein